MSKQPQRQQDDTYVPSAPYPPMFGSTARSSMSSTPQYSAPYGQIRNQDYATVGRNLGSSKRTQETFASEFETVENSGIGRQAYSDSSKSNRIISTYSPQIRLCSNRNDAFACINCAPPDRLSAETTRGGKLNEPGLPRKRKLGPVLLELRRLRFSEFCDPEDNQSIFATEILGISRGNPSLGTRVASTCIDTPNMQDCSSEPQSPLVAATGLTTGMLAIHSFGGNRDEDDLTPASIEYYHTSRHHRQASAVCWRPNNPNHVALGLLGSSALGPQQPRRGGQSSRVGDNELCCFLWDIEASAKRNSVAITRLSHTAPVASLAWMLNGQTLVVGGQSRNVQLYDLKASGTNVPPISAHAHNFGVHGIECCPHRPHLMATFCRSASEPVKLWDIRRMDSVFSEIKISMPGISSQSSSPPDSPVMAAEHVEAIKWSTLEPGILSVAVKDCVQDFDTKSSARPMLIRINRTQNAQSIKDFCLYRGAKFQPKELNSGANRVISELCSHRMVAVLDNRSVADIPKHTHAPVAISRRDGRLVHSLGPTVWVRSTDSGPAAMEKPVIESSDDVSATMMRRARCTATYRYSMNPTNNIKLLTNHPPEVQLEGDAGLLRIWSWIDRVESLCATGEEIDEDCQLKVKGLVDAGVWSLLEMDEEIVSDAGCFSEKLSWNVYESRARRAAMACCGWGGKFNKSCILSDSQAIGEHGRLAALAVWHGDVRAAILALQRASESFRLLPGRDDLSKLSPNQSYAETLDLIAMCIAGYDNSVPQSSVWQGACANLLRRTDLSGPQSNTSQVVYLRAMCKFLLDNGNSESRDQVLENPLISLSDRVAFACRFLDQRDLKSYLSKCVDNCRLIGNLEGLVISGFSKQGIQIIQSFVDRYSDVQTAALLVSRVILPAEWSHERKLCIEWVETYRGLLNTWQMWQSRALFDVDRAEVLRRVKAVAVDGSLQGSSKTVPYSSRRMQLSSRRVGARPTDPEVLASTPVQLDARCNYCSSPVGLRRLDAGNANQWLSKMKPVLSCCPQCRKPLPRCAVCLLSLGCLNPYMELTRERSRSNSRVASSTPDDFSSLANLPFAEWFTWCMRCKHGGHAHHLVGWFVSHETCPVSGCECRCQFDGVQNLRRPVLVSDADNTPQACCARR